MTIAVPYVRKPQEEHPKHAQEEHPKRHEEQKQQKKPRKFS